MDVLPIIYLIVALALLILFTDIVIVPFFKGVKEGVKRHETKKELIKKFDE